MMPVLVMVESQRAKVEQLAAFIKQLDGTDLKIILGGPGTEKRYPACNNYAFHQAAVEMRGQQFIWMEPDAIPLKAGWVQTISDEYARLKKPILISSDSNPPHDMVGGIGVYPPETHWLIPYEFKKDGWDKWMLNNLPDLIGKTSLIQHSYGTYNEHGYATPHRFPAESKMLRPESVLFHRDLFQDLIAPNVPSPFDSRSQPSFYHTGDLGDIIAALPIIRQLGGGNLVIGNHDPLHPGWRPMEGPRFAILKPLLDLQPYLASVRFEHHAPCTVDFSRFRYIYQPTRTLTLSQADWVGIKHVDVSPWLSVTASDRMKGRIVIARSERYHNSLFPWRQLVRMHGQHLTFLGLPEEYNQFMAEFGGSTSYLRTSNALEIAQLIAGADCFIGNQSMPCWIAMGLGKTLIQETCVPNPDSRIHRSNARFVSNAASLTAFQDLGIRI